MDANLFISLTNLAVLVIAAGSLGYRQGVVNTTVASMDKKLDKLDGTNGGGLARCTQHNEQIQEANRRHKDHVEEDNRRWAEIIARLDHIEE